MTALYIAIALFLVALNAFFVATEFAIVRVRATRIDELVERGVKRATAARGVLRDLNAYLSACQLGITFASLGLGWVGEPAFARIFERLFAGLGAAAGAAAHSAAIVTAFALITVLHVVLGELAPKTWAITRPEGVALAIAWPIRGFYRAFYPAIWGMNELANLTVRALGLRPASELDLAHSEDELRMILAVSSRSGAMKASHARLLENALDFSERTVRQIMVPRGDIVFLDLNHSLEENLLKARESGHTRFPLCEGDLDRVVGTIHIKDFFLASADSRDLRGLARPPVFLPESVRVDRALASFQKRHLHLGLVVDEYGGISGVVTVEDILEELIGEIQDEFDEERPKVEPLEGGRLSVDASLPIDEVEALGIREENEAGVDTLGGLIVDRLGRIARVGDRVTLGGRPVEVIRVRGRRILRVSVEPPPAPEAVPDSTEDA